MTGTQPPPQPTPPFLRNKALALLFIGGLLAMLWVRRPQPSPTETTTAKKSVRLHGASMGTKWHATIVDATDTARLQDAIQQALDAVDQRMSTWKPDSELSVLGASTSTQPQPVSEPLSTVLKIAATVSAKSDGAYDVTIAPVVDAWGFGPDTPAKAPEETRLATLLQAVGPDMLVLDQAAGTVTKTRPDVRIDLSSVAKGYGVDQAISAIVSLGYSDLMVEVGGEVKAGGHNPQGEPWRVGVERPDGSGGVYQAIDL
ncbi:MAG: FAD:protein FMN transferase, partial [Oligoflexia bacterium]|nr:FAD:protein FMN transferase [Oligoflexia bacterium]